MSFTDRPAAHRGAFEIRRPPAQTIPLVFASPHSGMHYPAAFLAATRLDATTLRKSEDSFVDELFAAAPRYGAPLISALFPRAFIDANREAYELDPAMFAETLPGFVNTASPRVAAGLGTVARVVASGEDIYPSKLSFAEVKERVERYWRPYHEALRRLVEETQTRFGWCLLIDCHSMPSVGGPSDRDAGRNRVDFVLGDCFGASCAPWIGDAAERLLKAGGAAVVRNTPYAGGFVTQHYGRPAEERHVLQIEINRALYMDEKLIRRTAGFAKLAEQMTTFVRDLGAVALARGGGQQAAAAQ